MSGSGPAERTSDEELRDLLRYLDRCPVGLVEIDDGRRVRRINPAAARMLTPALVGDEDLTALDGVLGRLCPELLARIVARPPRMGPLHVGRRTVATGTGPDQGAIELQVVRVDHDRVMIVCSEAGAERRRARRTLVLARRLRDLVAAAAVYRCAAARALQVSTSGVMALEELLTHGTRTPGAIARRIGLTATTLTTTIDQLEDAGLVLRARNPADRRSIVISLAPGAEQRVGPALELLVGGVDRVAERAAAAHDDDVAAVFDALVSALRTRALLRVAPPAPRRPAPRSRSGGTDAAG